MGETIKPLSTKKQHIKIKEISYDKPVLSLLTRVVSNFELSSNSAIFIGEITNIFSIICRNIARNRGFAPISQYLWGKVEKHFLIKVFSGIKISFRVVGVALFLIPCVL